MGGLAPAPPPQATSLIIILAQLHHIRLWGLDFFIYFTKNTTLQTNTLIFINIAKQHSFYGGSIIAFCSLILSTISKDAHNHLESFRCQRWGLMTRTGRYVADLTSYNHVLINTLSTAACYRIAGSTFVL
jgi:hypothetical protein